MNYSMKNYKQKITKSFLVRTTLKKLLLIVILLLSPIIMQAQEEIKAQAFTIHEDRVKPSMIEEYEQVTKDLIAKMTEHNIQGADWLTVSHNDYSYLFVSPMENFAELDKDVFAPLAEKMGEDAMKDLFARFGPCYDVHGDYVVYLQNELSYQPGGIDQNPEGQYYRKFYIDYVTPGNRKGYEAGLKKIKEMLAKNNSKLEYRVYSSGFGVMDANFMITFAAKSAEEFEKIMGETWEATKDEFDPLLQQLRKYVSTSEEKSGWMRGDLSYSSKK